MREKRTIQPSIFEIYPEHDIGRELKAMSKLLDAHPDLLDWVAADIKDRQPKATVLPFALAKGQSHNGRADP